MAGITNNMNKQGSKDCPYIGKQVAASHDQIGSSVATTPYISFSYILAWPIHDKYTLSLSLFGIP
jgi:hypothetical protein